MRESLPQLRFSLNDGLVILVDAAESKEISFSYIVNLVKTQVAQFQIIAFSLVDIGRKRIGPNGHEHRPILLRLSKERVWRMNKCDRFKISFAHSWPPRHCTLRQEVPGLSTVL